MEELIESTSAVSRGLETLQSEHATLLEELRATEHHEDAESDVNGEEMEGFAAQLKEEKEMALNESMEKLMVGISDAKVGIIKAMQYALLSIYTSLDLKAIDLVE